MSDSRFENVLRLEYPLFVKVLNDEKADVYIREVLKIYNELKKEAYIFHTSIYKTYLEFAVAVNAVYRYLLLNHVKHGEALNLLSEFCINTINKTLDRLSFIQLAFHYSTDKAYLKLITISSLITLENINMANDLKEHKMDEELNKSMKDCNIDKYFEYYEIEELMKIVDIVEKSFDMFIDKNLNHNSGEETVIKI